MTGASLIRAIIFDFNGVIIDDEEYHYEALKKVLGQLGVYITREDYFRDCLGFNDTECFLWALGNTTLIKEAGGIDVLIARKSRYYLDLLDEETRFFPGVIEFIRKACGRYHLAVASMAMRNEILLVLRKAEVHQCFKVIVGAEDVENTKPHPEVYLKALDRLNKTGCVDYLYGPIRPEHCLVIEDSLPGIRAAKAAGMWCLAIANSVSVDTLKEADWTCTSLEGMSLENLESLFPHHVHGTVS